MNGKGLKLSRPHWMAVFVCSLFVFGATARQAHAQCAAQPEDGNWVNADASTNSLTRAELRFTCQDQILNGQPYPPGPPWHMHLWGKCSPSDCDWGTADAENVTVGGRTFVRAIFHHGFATRYVYADMSISSFNLTKILDDCHGGRLILSAAG